MIRIGITGQSGFVGTHLYNTLGLMKDRFERIPFQDMFFQSKKRLCDFVRSCDVIVHLAALNRHRDSRVIYQTNIQLVKQLIDAMETENVAPYVIFSSSTQEELDNEYGRSKREGRALLEEWAKRNNASFTGLVIPNVFGPFGKPDYNSFIVTFCYKLTHGDFPKVLIDSDVRLVYIGSLCEHLIKKVLDVNSSPVSVIERKIIPSDFEKNVTEVLSVLENFKTLYFDQGIIPELKNKNELNLFNTFRCYIDMWRHFPVKLLLHADDRGVFVETVKMGIGGQVSLSITIPGVTRGNHFHTRKVERFTVIKGKARIQLRKIGTDEVLNFDLDGAEPSYVDMPVWYTHNITNIGNEMLYTQFWINEWYNQEDDDTYFEMV